jgi:hypothetical protein
VPVVVLVPVLTRRASVTFTATTAGAASWSRPSQNLSRTLAGTSTVAASVTVSPITPVTGVTEGMDWPSATTDGMDWAGATEGTDLIYAAPVALLPSGGLLPSTGTLPSAGASTLPFASTLPSKITVPG